LQELRRKSWDNAGVAVIAAYMLFLQGLLGAFAVGSADAAQLDVFGNPLCITSGEHGAAGTDTAHHETMPDCCAVSCGIVAPAAHEDRSPHSLANPLAVAAQPMPAPFAAIAHRFTVEQRPGSPRSPPALAD